MNKFISNLDGIVYSIDEKVIEPQNMTYRGENVSTMSAISKFFQYLIEHSDNLRINSKATHAAGKDLFKQICPKA